MWKYESSVESTTSPAAIWAQYTNTATWPAWNPGTDKVELSGPFQSGTEGVVTSDHFGPVPFRLVTVSDQHSFTMESPVNEDISLRTTCELTALPDGHVRVTHRVELAGPGNEQLGEAMGAGLSENLTQGLKALVAAAS